MEENSLLGMFDSYWFNHEILKKPAHPTNPEKNPDEKIPETSTQILPASSAESMEGLGLASSSIESSENQSPCSVLPSEKLQTIFSGKQMNDEEEDDDVNPIESTGEEELKKIRQREEEMRKSKRNMMMRMKKRGCSKSLTDLEFEEIKGFEELGFVFSEEDRNSTFLASILPGLQRLARDEQLEAQKVEEDGKEGEVKRSKSVDPSGVSRPYLAKVWWDDSAFSEEDKRSRENESLPLTMRPRNLPVNRETDMKNYLRNWAHSVAASMR